MRNEPAWKVETRAGSDSSNDMNRPSTPPASDASKVRKTELTSSSKVPVSYEGGETIRAD